MQNQNDEAIMLEYLLSRIEILENNIKRLNNISCVQNIVYHNPDYISDLKEKGYAVIPNVLSVDEINEAKQLFFKWKNSIPDIDKMHSTIDPHGIFKFHQAGHQEFAWYLRTRPQIIEIFKKIWNTEELIVSFDGSCYMPKEYSKRDNIWTHTDQAPNSKGLQCYQSFISLTTNSQKTLVVYENSHNIHEKYFTEKNIDSSKNWHLIAPSYLDKISHTKTILKVNEGDLVLWDSRTFHQNQYGIASLEERLVQYICYLPKSHPKNTITQQKKREKYLLEMRTTSHWPCPISVNSLQPQTYGDKSKLIDYDCLIKPDLSKYTDIIQTLI